MKLQVAYSDVAPKINQYPNLRICLDNSMEKVGFLRNKLEESVQHIPSLYNLITLRKNFIKQIQEEEVLSFKN